jgi:mannosyltransferase OCH1-like enzyme
MDELDQLTKSLNNSQFPFPKIIHQIWINDNPNIPDKWKIGPEEWKRLHPDWLYILWDKKLCDELITKYENDFYPYYKNYPYEIQRIDSVRYCILKRYGGLYCDLDMYPKKNIEDEFKVLGDCYFVTSANMKSSYTNSFFGGKSSSPIWSRLIEACKDKKKWYYMGKHLTVMSTTGPTMLTKVIRNYNGIVCTLPNVKFNSQGIEKIGSKQDDDSIIRILEGGSWHSFDSKIGGFVYQNWIFMTFIIIMLLILIIYLIFRYYKKCNICIKNDIKQI